MLIVLDTVNGAPNTFLLPPRHAVADLDFCRGNRHIATRQIARDGLDARQRLVRTDDNLTGEPPVAHTYDVDRLQRLAGGAEVQVEIRRHQVRVPDLQPLRTRRVRFEAICAGRTELHALKLTGVETHVIVELELSR